MIIQNQAGFEGQRQKV